MIFVVLFFIFYSNIGLTLKTSIKHSVNGFMAILVIEFTPWHFCGVYIIKKSIKTFKFLFWLFFSQFSLNMVIVSKWRNPLRNLSNSNFQRTKTLHQKEYFIINNIAFFFTFFKGYRCNELSAITPKKIFMRARENKCQI